MELITLSTPHFGTQQLRLRVKQKASVESISYLIFTKFDYLKALLISALGFTVLS